MHLTAVRLGPSPFLPLALSLLLCEMGVPRSEVFAPQHPLSAEGEPGRGAATFRVPLPSRPPPPPQQGWDGTHPPDPTPGRPDCFPWRPREGQGWPEATQLLQDSARLWSPPFVPASLGQEVLPPTPPRSIRNRGGAGRGRGPRPFLAAGVLWRSRPAPSTVWPQVGLARPLPGPRMWPRSSPPRSAAAEAGLPGRREEARAWLPEEPRICSKCKQQVILRLPPSPGGADTFDIGGDRWGGGCACGYF